MKKDNLIYIEHIRACIARIAVYTQGMDASAFLYQPLIQDAVIRNFEVIGEATKQLTSEFRSQYPEIAWHKISGMRDKLIHDYLGVDLLAVWGVVENVLPEFDNQLAAILDEHRGTSQD